MPIVNTGRFKRCPIYTQHLLGIIPNENIPINFYFDETPVARGDCSRLAGASSLPPVERRFPRSIHLWKNSQKSRIFHHILILNTFTDSIDIHYPENGLYLYIIALKMGKNESRREERHSKMSSEIKISAIWQ